MKENISEFEHHFFNYTNIAENACQKKIKDNTYELTEIEKIAICIVGGCDYKLEPDNNLNAYTFNIIVENVDILWNGYNYSVFQLLDK